jgi:hypothetical protein
MPSQARRPGRQGDTAVARSGGGLIDLIEGKIEIEQPPGDRAAA